VLTIVEESLHCPRSVDYISSGPKSDLCETNFYFVNGVSKV
jgi:hypothetical protein